MWVLSEFVTPLYTGVNSKCDLIQPILNSAAKHACVVWMKTSVSSNCDDTKVGDFAEELYIYHPNALNVKQQQLEMLG